MAETLACSPFAPVTFPSNVDANPQTDRIPETVDGRLSLDAPNTAV